MNEFAGADLDRLPYHVTERAGDLHVWYKDILLGRFPWHTHAQADERGRLHLLDLRTGRWFREFPEGGWTTVNRMLRA